MIVEFFYNNIKNIFKFCKIYKYNFGIFFICKTSINLDKIYIKMLFSSIFYNKKYFYIKSKKCKNNKIYYIFIL